MSGFKPGLLLKSDWIHKYFRSVGHYANSIPFPNCSSPAYAYYEALCSNIAKILELQAPLK